MTDTGDGCLKCNEVKAKYRNQSTDSNFFIVHATRDIIKGPQSSEKKSLLDKVSTRVSALRNHNGGALIVHLDGQVKTDRSLEYFDQFASERLTKLTDDGEGYASVYKRLWLNRLPQLLDNFDFVLLKVKRSRSVSTIDSNTKLRNDFENVTPSTLNILKLLSQSCSGSNDHGQFVPLGEGPVDRDSLLFPTAPKIRGLQDDPQAFHEDRHIEHKCIWPKNAETLQKFENSEAEFVNYLWTDLKLRDNVTSMSKIKEGGSVFCGVLEIKDSVTGSPRPLIHGFVKVFDQPDNKAEIEKLRNQEQKGKKKDSKKGHKIAKNESPPILKVKLDEGKLREAFEEKIKSELTVLAEGRFTCLDPWRVINIAFHDVPNSSPEKRVVLEVAIAYTPGVIFYDKLGPRAYEIKDNTDIRRMDKHQWLTKFSNLYESFGNQLMIPKSRSSSF